MSAKNKLPERIYTHTLAGIEIEAVCDSLDRRLYEIRGDIQAQNNLAPRSRDESFLMRSQLKEHVYEGLLTAFEDALEDHQDGARVQLIVRPIA
ncbi:hypothetical protein HMPREF9306_01457 [Propionimicrobium lymphophilum ACS-093-V-SCH5]|uniref:Uncharacterized protein n=1 Tax=Propionimicrobium lymphophilum ACS-093-V-SCH5 TaxID=883161 RepID=S2VYG5_9ACTN|nr:hypothetical protein [Propionimicrobium lymphophilum]EPD31901.1 hypothetical protein HMPREF9306_01457 [Propionimicrobium lymphophilum ACS-093-V-SCH5]